MLKHHQLDQFDVAVDAVDEALVGFMIGDQKDDVETQMLKPEAVTLLIANSRHWFPPPEPKLQLAYLPNKRYPKMLNVAVFHFFLSKGTMGDEMVEDMLTDLAM